MSYRRIFSLMLVLAIFIPAGTALGAPLAGVEAPTAAPEAWEEIAPGIQYQLFHLSNPRPINIFVTRMERGSPNVTIESSIAQGKLAYGTEQISGMANRYDQAINYWGEWGNRNHVAVAINGYFFGSPYELPGVPWSGQVHSGWYAKRYSDAVGDAGFAWMMDGDARIGSCVFHNSKQFITFGDTGYAPKFQGINVEHDDENIILYTPQYDTDTNTNTDEPILEILVEMTQPAALVASPNMVKGYIREIQDGVGSMPIPFDHVVISAWGGVRLDILDVVGTGEIAIGDEVGISQEISNCPTSPHQFDWTNTYAGIGGDYHFLNDGVVRTDFSNPDATYPNSRTVIAYSPEYVFYMVADRWNPGVSEGITIPELGYFARDTLGATDAVSQDSGGSSTMVVNGEVVNNTYCNWTDCRPKVLLEETQIITGTPDTNIPRGVEIVAPGSVNGSASWNEAGILEALVANGMLMVAVEPIVQSTTFTPTDMIPTDTEAKIRLGPGNNYAAFDIIPPGTNVEVLAHMNGLNGVLAKGSYWWKVNYAGKAGWLREQDLQGGQTPGLNADFTASVNAGVAPLSVDFTNASFGYYTDSLWDFGDGGSSVEEHPSYIFNTPGVYTVTLTIAGPSGEDTEEKPAYITVYEPVKADFTVQPSIGTPPLIAIFSNTSTGDFTDWLWAFEDNSTSIEINPSREYTTTGVYSATLTVSGPGGTDTLSVPTAVGVYDEIYNIYLPAVQSTLIAPTVSQSVLPLPAYINFNQFPSPSIYHRDE
jgi:PKD repeat protein